MLSTLLGASRKLLNSLLSYNELFPFDLVRPWSCCYDFATFPF